MKRSNIIRDSNSPWSFPLVVVRKKPDRSGKQKLRVCVNFRKLNEFSENLAFPLPRTEDILDSLGGAKYFSTLDFSQGFYQIKVHEDDIPKTAFSFKGGHFEFVRLPFGLSSAPQTFSKAMKIVLSGLEEASLAYMDDIICFGSSIETHNEHLEKIFQRLSEHKLKLQPNKCTFLSKEAHYLGHVITQHGVSPNPLKIQCIVDHPIPKDTKALKSFLGICNYYRKFLSGFANIAKPLTTLLQKNVPFVWSDICDKSFNDLKTMLTTAPLLQYPKWDEPFNLATDASGFAIGSVLSQGPIGEDLPIAYASRTLNKAEQNYSVILKECLSIIWSVKHFKEYLYGRHFIIITDHRPLTYLFGIKDVSSQLMRW